MQTPRLVSSAVVQKDGKILLVKEKQNDNRDWWVFPGGGVEFGEKASEAAKRELKEELSLEIKINKLLGFWEAIYPEHDYHTIVFFFLADMLNETISPIKNIIEAKFFTLEEAKKLDLVESAKFVIRKLEE